MVLFLWNEIVLYVLILYCYERKQIALFVAPFPII